MNDIMKNDFSGSLGTKSGIPQPDIIEKCEPVTVILARMLNKRSIRRSL